MTDAPEFAQAWGGAVQALAKASALDNKTRDLAYLAVLAALNRTSGIPSILLRSNKMAQPGKRSSAPSWSVYQLRVMLLHKPCPQHSPLMMQNKPADILENLIWRGQSTKNIYADIKPSRIGLLTPTPMGIGQRIGRVKGLERAALFSQPPEQCHPAVT